MQKGWSIIQAFTVFKDINIKIFLGYRNIFKIQVIRLEVFNNSVLLSEVNNMV